MQFKIILWPILIFALQIQEFAEFYVFMVKSLGASMLSWNFVISILYPSGNLYNNTFTNFVVQQNF